MRMAYNSHEKHNDVNMIYFDLSQKRIGELKRELKNISQRIFRHKIIDFIFLNPFRNIKFSIEINLKRVGRNSLNTSITR
ncbi:hypothetical protein YN1HA_6760 [Sulfurisphaera ohwakuensis]